MTMQPNDDSIVVIAPLLLPLLGLLFGLLTGVIAWVGVRMQTRLDDIAKSLHEIERGWTVKLGTMDRRLTRVEALCPHCSGRNGFSPEHEEAAP